MDKSKYNIYTTQPPIGQIIGDYNTTRMDFHNGKAEITSQRSAEGVVDLVAYQQEVQRTCATAGNREETIKMALIGLQGELGEIAEPLKKNLWHKHDLDLDVLQKEIGDATWYLTTLCNALGLSLAEIIAENVKKLRDRYPDGFDTQKSRDRKE